MLLDHGSGDQLTSRHGPDAATSTLGGAHLSASPLLSRSQVSCAIILLTSKTCSTTCSSPRPSLAAEAPLCHAQIELVHRTQVMAIHSNARCPLVGRFEGDASIIDALECRRRGTSDVLLVPLSW